MSSQLAQLLAIIGALVTLAAIAGGLTAVFRNAANQATITRLREERDDYLSRLNYIEPKLEAAVRENETLHSLNDPGPRLEKLDEDARRRHGEVMRVLDAQSRSLQAIDEQVHPPRDDGRRT